MKAWDTLGILLIAAAVGAAIAWTIYAVVYLAELFAVPYPVIIAGMFLTALVVGGASR